ncbi:hypothetical protein E2C01_019140 [Portunus trituberculatus]|uniref:Uncharacterized protein n=1 Tax=Portunus trituberculatus TaxID=210409 RepID=A0A5B7DYF8_PORTR|nr:hypothetical protein [Portunus trituberculatus]
MSDQCLIYPYTHPFIPQEEALLCDERLRWQHRTCGSGVTRMQYRTAVKNDHDIDWRGQFYRKHSPIQPTESPIQAAGSPIHPTSSPIQAAGSLI